MAITRWRSTVICETCGAEAEVWRRRGQGVPETIEAPPDGWTETDGVYACEDHITLEVEVPTRSIPRHVTGAAPEPETVEEETDGS